MLLPDWAWDETEKLFRTQSYQYVVRGLMLCEKRDVGARLYKTRRNRYMARVFPIDNHYSRDSTLLCKH